MTDPGVRMEADRAGGEWEPTRVPVYAVVRFDPSRSGAEHQVMIWEVLTSIDEAEAEVDHLNAQVPEGRPITYFIAATCFYPEGRHAEPRTWGRRPEPPRRTPVGPPAPPERVAGEWGFLVGDEEGEERPDPPR